MWLHGSQLGQRALHDIFEERTLRHGPAQQADLPPGVVNIVTGPRDDLARVLAAHDEVAAMWMVGGDLAAVEKAAA